MITELQKINDYRRHLLHQ